jgi:diacylglycerol kinase (ATP)
MSRTLIILNPHAGGGRAGRVWRELEPLLWEQLGELVIAVTQRAEEVGHHLDEARACGISRVISIGGDGTNHALVNALAQHNERYPDAAPMIYGILPIGTGRDWARGLGIPIRDLRAAAEWIARAQPGPVDLGLLQRAGAPGEYFLNIASAGLGGAVVQRVERAAVRRPWTFLKATVQTILRYTPKPMQVLVDGELWHDDPAYILAIANGTTFGHGMKIAPEARYNDGLFDVLVVRAVSRWQVLMALRRVYAGSHLTHPAVRYARARRVDVRDPGGDLQIELDGEYAQGSGLTFTLRPGLLHMLGASSAC